MDRIDFLEFSINRKLDVLFGAGSTTETIIDDVKHLKGWCVARLLTSLKDTARENIKSAVLWLYDPLPNPMASFRPAFSPAKSSFFSPGNIFTWLAKRPPFKPMPWKTSGALLRLWASLVSEEASVVFSSISSGDWSDVDACYLAKWGKSPSLEDSYQFADNILEMILQAFETVQNIKHPVKELTSKDIEDIHKTRKLESLDYDFESYRMAWDNILLSIDPYNNIEDIIKGVRQAIEAKQNAMLEEHNATWTENERELLGQGFIDSQSPLNAFVFKPTGHTGTGLEEFTEDAVVALLIFELCRHMPEKEICKSFFPLWFDDKGPDCRPKSKRKHRRKVTATEIISKALAGSNIGPYYIV